MVKTGPVGPTFEFPHAADMYGLVHEMTYTFDGHYVTRCGIKPPLRASEAEVDCAVCVIERRRLDARRKFREEHPEEWAKQQEERRGSRRPLMAGRNGELV